MWEDPTGVAFGLVTETPPSLYGPVGVLQPTSSTLTRSGPLLGCKRCDPDHVGGVETCRERRRTLRGWWGWGEGPVSGGRGPQEIEQGTG